MKRILILIPALFAAFMSFGQQPQALPNDPAVKVGKLENGLTYYIRHNDKPAQRAEFYLATDVGAFQEEVLFFFFGASYSVMSNSLRPHEL